MTIDRTEWFRDKALPVIYALERLTAGNHSTKKPTFCAYDNRVEYTWADLKNPNIYLAITLDGEHGCQDITVTYNERTTTYREREYHIASRELKKVLKVE